MKKEPFIVRWAAVWVFLICAGTVASWVNALYILPRVVRWGVVISAGWGTLAFFLAYLKSRRPS